ncbi:zinc finger domain-containing protein [Ophiocordyceps sinensis CO18]|uniref:Postreplication repair E3 ubiquitin-protein ligase RAD18 n=1 Tax=Ophiocordyceps sinensis (strain Co18 / CGMCC 3.14243) TaxID=911162 RepID=T5AMP7_OPHSC|nr:zinc finger domain-containing protein [Ophiocordyceps sinensis CO18]
MPADDVPDSTDWLGTPLSGLAAVEAALRCQVCKDFYKTPMLTSCSHTFCSLCIRRALSNDGKCPVCRASEQELKLRSNCPGEGFALRKPLYKEESRRESQADTNFSASEQDVPEPPDANPKRIRTSARLSKTRAGVAVASSEVIPEEEVVKTSEDDEYIPDKCTPPLFPRDWQAQANAYTSIWKNAQVLRPSEEAEAATALHRSHERLPALNYSMLKDGALRKRMTELGLSSQGPRLLLERRHKEWLTLWNANCDAARPKKRLELLHDLDTWERTQGGRAPTTGRSFQTAAAIKDKDFDGAAWAVKHDNSFKDLIASARKTKSDANARAAKTDERPAQDEQAEASAIVADSQVSSLLSSTRTDVQSDEPRRRSGDEQMVILEGSTKSMATTLATTIPSPHLDGSGPGAQDAAG